MKRKKDRHILLDNTQGETGEINALQSKGCLALSFVVPWKRWLLGLSVQQEPNFREQDTQLMQMKH